jgi:hypothetical protein
LVIRHRARRAYRPPRAQAACALLADRLATPRAAGEDLTNVLPGGVTSIQYFDVFERELQASLARSYLSMAFCEANRQQHARGEWQAASPFLIFPLRPACSWSEDSWPICPAVFCPAENKVAFLSCQRVCG